MKEIMSLAYFFFLILKVDAQNLVMNSDMEQYTSCPTLQGQSNYATNYLALNPSPFAADYLNACATNGACDVPVNYSGYQIAHSGNAYSGIYLRQSPGSNTKEYVEGTLSALLIPNRCYHFEMYISLGNICKYTSDAISVYFSDTSITGNSLFAPLSFVPQINNAAGNFPDTSNWILVSGDFTASGGENYFIIGSFVNDAQMNQQLINNSGSDVVYVYVDDISIVSCGTGIDETEKNYDVKVFPNPASAELTITTNNNEISEIEIYDVVSREILQKQFSQSTTLEITELKSGIYFYEVKNKNGETVIGRFVKQ